MKHLTLILVLNAALSLLFCPLKAQTVIDLNRGGTVHSKTLSDYDIQHIGNLQREIEDSLAYVENLKWAFSALATDSLDHAEAYFGAALHLRPTAPGNYVVRHNLGRIQMARGRWNDAIQLLTMALADRDSARDIRYDRAQAYYEAEHYRQCADDVSLLIDQTAPGDTLGRVELLLFRAAALDADGRSAEALPDLEEVLRLDDTHTEARMLMAMTLGGQHEAEGLYDLAREYYDEAIALAPDTPYLYVARGRCYEHLDLPVHARRDYERAAALVSGTTTDQTTPKF